MSEQEINNILDKYNQGIQLYDCFGGKILSIQKYNLEVESYFGKYYLTSENFDYMFLHELTIDKITE